LYVDLSALLGVSSFALVLALTAYQLLALMSAKFLGSFFGDWYLQ
jgi:hypothetical protein